MFIVLVGNAQLNKTLSRMYLSNFHISPCCESALYILIFGVVWNYDVFIHVVGSYKLVAFLPTRTSFYTTFLKNCGRY